MAGRPPAVTDFEIALAIGRARRETGDPVATTGEIADRVPIKREGVGRRLNAMAETGLVDRKQVGRSYIWWLTAEVRTALQPYLHEDAAPSDADARIRELFSVGRDRFDLEIGAIARIDADRDHFELERVNDPIPGFGPGDEFPLSETYCQTTAVERGPASVDDPSAAGLADSLVHTDLGFETYLGTFLDVRGDSDRTFFFVSTEPRADPFTQTDRAYHDLLGQGAKLELQDRYSPIRG